MKRGEKPETSLPQAPYVDPRAVINPQAVAYARAVQERAYNEPRGGGPTPPIPPLNAPHVDGMTMADQAASFRPPPQQPAFPQAQNPQTIFAPTPDMAARIAAQAGSGLLQTDLLPDQAKQDPMFREGQGSMYAIHQPNIAAKYGVLRNGRHVPPQELQSGRSGLKPQTIEGLKAVQEFQQQRRAAENGDTTAERAAREGIAGQAARLANPSGGEDVKPVTEDQRKEVERALRSMDDFDLDMFRETMMKDLLNNDEQRTIVEERVQALDLGEYIMNGRVYQNVPIIPGKYEPIFQSFTAEEELALKRLLMEEKKNMGAPDRYFLDKFQLMTVALGLYSLNKETMPPHTDKEGNFDDLAFWKKFNRAIKMPFHVLASLSVHYFYFDVRVRKLLVAERLKNG